MEGRGLRHRDRAIYAQGAYRLDDEVAYHTATDDEYLVIAARHIVQQSLKRYRKWLYHSALLRGYALRQFENLAFVRYEIRCEAPAQVTRYADK